MITWREDKGGVLSANFAERLNAIFSDRDIPRIAPEVDDPAASEADKFGFLVDRRWHELDPWEVKLHYFAYARIPDSAALYYLPAWINSALLAPGEPGGVVSEVVTSWLEAILQKEEATKSIFSCSEFTFLKELLEYISH